MEIVTAVLVASLLGSLHCAGMCGALVAFAVGDPSVTSIRSRAMLQLAYHGGRLLSYALLGAVCGLLGAALDLGGSLLGWNRAAAVLAGLMMIAVGLIALARYGGLRLPALPGSGLLSRAVMVGRKAAVGLRPLPRAATIGLLSALLPCGWLYAFGIVAASTGSAAWGAAILVAFWLGTVPVLASVGVGVQTLSGTLGRWIPQATAVIIVLLGLYSVAGRAPLLAHGWKPPAKPAAGKSTLEQVDDIRHNKKPCCQHHGQ